LLPVFLCIAATQALQRGAATGHARFSAIAGQLCTDGLLRVGFTIGLVVTGTATELTLVLGTCLAAGLSLVVGDRMCPQWFARPRLRDVNVAWTPIVLLLIGAVGPVLANSGPVPWLKATGGVSDTTFLAFTGAVTLSRIPTQFISAAFGPLLSQLAHAAEIGDTATFRQVRRSGDAAAAALGGVFVAAFAILGPTVLSIYLGPRYVLSVPVLAALASASGLLFVAVVQQASLAALDRWGIIAGAWVIGCIVLIGFLLLPLDSLNRAAFAPAAAVTTALAIMLCARLRPEHSARHR
jgi:O-antigen/teichoic acid export membrane protein